MMAKYLMGLDVGGSGARCLLVNSETGKTTTAFRAWSHPADPRAGGWAFNLDVANVWRSLGETAQEAVKRAQIAPKDVAGIAATSMRHSTVVLDRQGNVLMATPNKDARAVNQSTRLAMDCGAELYQRTGHCPSPFLAACRLLWLKENDPDTWKSAQTVLCISDWISYLLTGNLAAELSQAAESLLFDLQTRDWAFDLIQSLGLPKHIFPPLLKAGAQLGKLSDKAAANLGLMAGTLVAVGGADTQSGLLGAGAVSIGQTGQIGIIAGTTTPIQMATQQPILDSQMRLWAGLHIIPGLYVLESNAGAMGSALEWFAQIIYPDARNPAACLAAEAEASSPGAGGISSTIGAAVFNAGAMGLPVDNLTFSSVNMKGGAEGRANVARAVLEGMAFAVRANIEQIKEVSHASEVEVWLGGGMSRSPAWAGIIGNVMNCKVHVSALPEVTALGAAICAGVGAGLYPDLVAGAKAITHTVELAPDKAASKIYQGLYSDWQSLRAQRAEADLAAANQIVQMMAGQEAGEGNVAGRLFRPRIYVSAEVDEAALARLRELGDVTYASYREQAQMLVGEELVETLAGYHVFVTEVDVVSAQDLGKLPDLRMIAVCRGNPVNVDIAACTAASVPVINTPARNADAVADLAVSFMLMLARKMPGAIAFLRQPGGEAGDLGRMGMAHDQFQGRELWRKTIGIVGGGAVGRKVARRLLPFEARILVYDPYVSAGQAALMGAEQVSLEQLLAESDFITLHAPVTDETREMINADALAKIKPGAFLINTARAALVDYEALIAALQSGKLGGAAVDVFPVEPPGADDPLLAFPNIVIATPHMGGNTFEVAAHQGGIVADELALLLAGKRPRHILNDAALATFSWTGQRQVSEAALRQLATLPGPGATDLDVAAQKTKQAATVQAQPVIASPDPFASARGALQGAKPSPALVEKKGGLLSMFKKALNVASPMPHSPATTAPAAAAPGVNKRDQMTRILTEFLARVAADQDLAAFSEGKNVVMHFTLKDMAQAFFLSFVGGQVSAGLGDPPREPDVRLKMSADTLDGMFTGRVNATRAAMSGKLSFSGDTSKAMAFQRIQKDMGRLYTEAREKIGDPGDLTQLGAAPSTRTAQPQAAPPPSPSPAERGRAEVGDIRDSVLQINNELYAKGLITPTGGNISARTDDNPNEIWITPNAIFKGDLRPAMMVRTDLDGNIVSETDYSASSERRVHCAIYRARPDITAVIHTHAPQATLMALTGTKFMPISTEAAFLGDIPVVPFIVPGTNELGNAVAQAMGTGVAVLMQNHGLVVAGSSLRRAADVTDVVEVTAEKILTCKLLGIEPPRLPEEIVKTLREIGEMMA